MSFFRVITNNPIRRFINHRRITILVSVSFMISYWDHSFSCKTKYLHSVFHELKIGFCIRSKSLPFQHKATNKYFSQIVRGDFCCGMMWTHFTFEQNRITKLLYWLFSKLLVAYTYSKVQVVRERCVKSCMNNSIFQHSFISKRNRIF